jgi:hypothetical protein
MTHPIIGRDWHRVGRTYRTSEAAFGTPFVAPRRRRIDIDDVIGIACGVIALGIAAAWLAGVIA